jgi:hypothetical protein
MVGNGLIQKRAADLGFCAAWVKKNPDFNPSKIDFFKKSPESILLRIFPLQRKTCTQSINPWQQIHI